MADECDELNAEIIALEAELVAVRAERDALRAENERMPRHNRYCSAAGWKCPIGCEKWDDGAAASPVPGGPSDELP